MSNESKDPRDSDTLRDLPKLQKMLRDTVPEQAGVYVAPRPLAPTSDHRTIQIKPVVLASHLDPRRAPTELRLSAPPRLHPPPRLHRRVAWLMIPLGLAAVALGALAAVHWTAGTAPASAGGPAPSPSDPAPGQHGESVMVSNPERGSAHGQSAPSPGSQAAGTTPEVAFTALPIAPPAPSMPPRKKKQRDPWLE